MKKTSQYRQKLKELTSWDEYLLLESGLPGPRGNIELAQAVADEGNEASRRSVYKGWTWHGSSPGKLQILNSKAMKIYADSLEAL